MKIKVKHKKLYSRCNKLLQVALKDIHFVSRDYEVLAVIEAIKSLDNFNKARNKNNEISQHGDRSNR